MTDKEKTHYRKAFDSPYLSAADIVDPLVLTIKRVVLEKDRTKKTQDEFNTCHWVEPFIRTGEPLKPMILNATNSKFLAQLTGSKWIDDWAGAKVTVWVDGAVRFGRETVEGLRLAKAAAVPSGPPDALVADAEKAAAAGTDSLRSWWNAASEENRKLLVARFKDLKAKAAQADTKQPPKQATEGGAE